LLSCRTVGAVTLIPPRERRITMGAQPLTHQRAAHDAVVERETQCSGLCCRPERHSPARAWTRLTGERATADCALARGAHLAIEEPRPESYASGDDGRRLQRDWGQDRFEKKATEPLIGAVRWSPNELGILTNKRGFVRAGRLSRPRTRDDQKESDAKEWSRQTSSVERRRSRDWSPHCGHRGAGEPRPLGSHSRRLKGRPGNTLPKRTGRSGARLRGVGVCSASGSRRMTSLPDTPALREPGAAESSRGAGLEHVGERTPRRIFVLTSLPALRDSPRRTSGLGDSARQHGGPFHETTVARAAPCRRRLTRPR
jgi:hypothetical protein